MIILDTKGQAHGERRGFPEQQEPPLFGATAIVSAAALKERFAPTDTDSLAHTGVSLTVDDDLSDMAGYFPHLAMVELVFSQFKDGRPFSTAVVLRRDFEFKGAILAAGDFLPDQALFLLRAGFSAFVVPEQFTAKQFKSALLAYSVAYQPGLGGTPDLVKTLRDPPTAVAAG